MIRKSFVLASGMALVCATAAQAQKVGTYSGQSADGNFMSMSVTESGGVFSISTANVNFVANCDSGGTASEGWGFFLGIPTNGGDTPFASSDDYYDIFGSLHFPNNNTIKGTVTSLTAVFTRGHTPPRKAQFCKSAKQSFTLTFQTAPGENGIEPGTAVVRHIDPQ